MQKESAAGGCSLSREWIREEESPTTDTAAQHAGRNAGRDPAIRLKRGNAGDPAKRQVLEL